MTWSRHAARIAALMIVAAGLFGWLASHSEVMFNDGLRYIGQAQQIEKGSLADGVLKAVDHPIYPLSIVAMHRLSGSDTPQSWERAAGLAAVLAGVLWIIPFYLISVELYGGASAWLAGLLALAIPLTGHVMGDVLSESTFLLFWSCGLLCALKFLRIGTFGWLPPTIAFAALAYLTRPEGLLLPMALIGSLALMPLLRSTRMNWPRWRAAVGFLVIGPCLILGPYIAMKGGLGTKPAIARLLGTAPKSPALAVERQRPLDENQSVGRTYLLAAREVGLSLREGVTIPLLPLVLLGLFFAWPPGEKARAWLFVTLIIVGSLLALMRLHATGGYCTPRHAMIVIYPLITLAAVGLHNLIAKISIPGRWLGLPDGRYSFGPALWVALLAGIGLFYQKDTLAPINLTNAGYRSAGDYVSRESKTDDRVVDLTGLTQFYGSRSGYTFADLHAAFGDPGVRWVVVREAHLRGQWPYCEQMRRMIGDREPVATFPEQPVRSQSKVYVYQLGDPQLARKEGVTR